MSRHRFFLFGVLAESDIVDLPLSQADVHHMVNVLRVSSGEAIEVIDPEGRGWIVEIVSASASALTARRLGALESSPVPRVRLYQGLAKGEKMDDIVRQCVEIGVSHITPVITARSVVRLDASKRTAKGERWRRVARAAAEQAHRDLVPRVDDPVDFKRAAEEIADGGRGFVLWEQAERPGLYHAATGLSGEPGPVSLFVGPEGGFEEAEVATLQEAGLVPVTVGPTILRTETAAIVALTLTLQALGGLAADVD